MFFFFHRKKKNIKKIKKEKEQSPSMYPRGGGRSAEADQMNGVRIITNRKTKKSLKSAKPCGKVILSILYERA